MAPRLGKPLDNPFSVRILTTHPDRDYLLATADTVSRTGWPEGGNDGPAAEVTMPAEALLRLAYGRLAPEYTQATVSGDPADLNKLRAVFPGF
ncbi:MAG TPA: hypothetical protein VMV07_27330 [Streptosporangiaceae bacterium]|nr:hypothetical protein [Streptosporangiaceae bacterium]